MMAPGSGLGRSSGFVAGPPSSRPAVTPVPSLTPRELEVLRRMALGMTVRTIKADLGVSQHTYYNHLRHIYEKLGVSCREDAYRALGWLEVA